jgi:hypothetical protein
VVVFGLFILSGSIFDMEPKVHKMTFTPEQLQMWVYLLSWPYLEDATLHALSALSRFEAEQQRKAKQHPLFSTSAAEYGKVPRGVSLEVKPPEHGKIGAFTQAFPTGAPSKDTRLTTSTSKHRYLSALD